MVSFLKSSKYTHSSARYFVQRCPTADIFAVVSGGPTSLILLEVRPDATAVAIETTVDNRGAKG